MKAASGERPYTPPPLFSGGHIQTIYPSLFRKPVGPAYTRERLEIDDGDFLDLDWSQRGFSRLAVISHGLEGDSNRAYVKGMASALTRAGWDVLAWNFRTCGGETNRLLRFYHNGATDDLMRVVDHGAATGRYRAIGLVGFSMGGNLSLVYLGEAPARVNPLVAGAAVFSVPCDLAAGAEELARPANSIYMKRFLRHLHAKVRAKMRLMPNRIDDSGYHRLKTFKDFDDRYTAPIHGFKSAEDYWARCSSGQFIPEIRVPTLVVNALNDPFLAGACYPRREAAANGNVRLEMPASGGHVGFISFNSEKRYWSESRASEFLSACAPG